MAMMVSRIRNAMLVTAACSCLAVIKDDMSVVQGPCDVYAAGGSPCVAAHSMVRAMYANYTGPLYMLQRASDNATKDITVLGTGFADAAAQVAFCTQPEPTVCTVERIYDQSPHGNHLQRVIIVDDKHPSAGINAMRDEIAVGGHAAFGAYFEGGTPDRSGTMGFRTDRRSLGNASGVAIGDEPESMYMVAAGTHYNSGCCFDYGNSEIAACGFPGTPPCGKPALAPAPAPAPAWQLPLSPTATPTPWPPNCGPPAKSGCGRMEAISWSDQQRGGGGGYGANHPGEGLGPWVMADLEQGVWAGNDPVVNPGNPTWNTSTFVTAMLKGKSGHFALKAGDAQSGQLRTLYDGARPPGYEVMKKEGAIVLGIGGDNSDRGVGTFYEGALTASYTSDATDNAVQANIVAAAYGK